MRVTALSFTHNLYTCWQAQTTSDTWPFRQNDMYKSIEERQILYETITDASKSYSYQLHAAISTHNLLYLLLTSTSNFQVAKRRANLCTYDVLFKHDESSQIKRLRSSITEAGLTGKFVGVQKHLGDMVRVVGLAAALIIPIQAPAAC
jgi:hypothetical protein